MNGIYHIKSDVPHSPLVTYSHVSIFMQISTPLLHTASSLSAQALRVLHLSVSNL